MKLTKWIPLAALLLAGSLFAGPITYTVIMTGPGESPPNASPGTGSAVIIIDSTANTLNIASDTFSGLLGTTTASHIHCCTALPGVGTARVATQVPSFAGFPNGVTSGSYSMNFDMTQDATWNPAFITANGGTVAGAESVLAAGAAAGDAYLIFYPNRRNKTNYRKLLSNLCLRKKYAEYVSGFSGRNRSSQQQSR
jgi:hypothetical protein